MRNEKFGYLIRIIAGAYLIYLAYQLIQGVMSGENDNPALGIAAGVLFIVAGAAFVIFSIRGLMRGGQGSATEEEAPEAEPEKEPERLEADGEAEETTDAPAEVKDGGDDPEAAAETADAEEEAEAAGEQAAFSEEKEEKEKE